MKKLILTDSGKEIECIEFDKFSVWMTEDQIKESGVRPTSFSNGAWVRESIKTDQGNLAVYEGLNIAGEAISFLAFGGLLCQTQIFNITSLKHVPDEDIYKERFARVTCILGKIRHTDDDGINKEIAQILQCSETEAKAYLDSSRQKDQGNFEFDIMGETIMNGSLGELLSEAEHYMVLKNNSRRFEIFTGKVSDSYEERFAIVTLNEHIARCHYLYYLLEGNSQEDALRKTSIMEGITIEECEERISCDRQARG